MMSKVAPLNPNAGLFEWTEPASHPDGLQGRLRHHSIPESSIKRLYCMEVSAGPSRATKRRNQDKMRQRKPLV